MKKAIWNTLPPKNEDLVRLTKLLSKGPANLSSLHLRLDISKTRALCAADHLVNTGAAVQLGSNEIALKL